MDALTPTHQNATEEIEVELIQDGFGWLMEQRAIQHRQRLIDAVNLYIKEKNKELQRNNFQNISIKIKLP